ncbi:GAF domain-containing protein [Jatrophihabitans sp. GAS493]|uniref:PP2C family protein-serine/threonine phosphatase n=1 Tax=Jatrophihabitans sp. GAS493 TaxID=1907575 RepID=UPI000BBFAFF1|nr:GAF domain-containing SpoIIE family protein phosphatase [Jatrophihabitans sp. GAS493]SOD74912.1 GAF domain-containing protein [Jatrophihabitans sp. GAS493]
MEEVQEADFQRDVLSLVDTSLDALDVDDLLTHLLERVRGILDADTAAVLMRADGADVLIARAACGLEEEVRQGVRIPIGTGFAGVIAATGQPLLLERIDATTVHNPILWEKGIQMMLGVPLLSGDEVLGVIHVGRLEDRTFTEADTQLLEVVAARVTTAVQARQLAIETAAARLLERSLQPAELPRIPGLEFAARYVPAEGRAVGGDWYDAFISPSGQLWLVTGDVAGHGLNAAVVMGRMKSAFRSFTLVNDDPAEVLTLTDRKLQHFEPGAMLTIVCAALRPPYDEIRISSAGHLPPVILQRGQAAELAPIAVGPPLGVRLATRRLTTTHEFPPGSELVLYTDGLIERRDEPIDEGLLRLRRAMVDAHPEALCQQLMHHLVGGAPLQDDTALLVVRRR